MLLEQALEPAGGDARVSARILAGDQHGQFERVEQAQLWKLSRRGDRREDVPALDRLQEDPVGMALRGRRCSSSGPSGSASLTSRRPTESKAVPTWPSVSRMPSL
jgi:hypothetical protein